MATKIWVNIGLGIGLLPDGTKPLPEPMLSDHQWSPVTFILGQFHKRCPNHQSLKSVWKLHAQNFIQNSQDCDTFIANALEVQFCRKPTIYTQGMPYALHPHSFRHRTCWYRCYLPPKCSRVLFWHRAIVLFSLRVVRWRNNRRSLQNAKSSNIHATEMMQKWIKHWVI